MQPSATGTDRASERQKRKETDRVRERENWRQNGSKWEACAGNIHPHNVRLSQSFSINLSAISCEHKGRSYAMWTY